MRWLIPRLAAFEAARPEVAVHVTTVTTVHDELRGGFDVAIRRGFGSGAGASWPQHRATRFLDEFDVLVVSPSFLRRHPIDRPDDVRELPRLATEIRPRDWADWLRAAGLLAPGAPRRVFDHFFVTLQAVTDGFGLDIGPLPVLEDSELRAGRLLAPLPAIRIERPGYHAPVPFDADKSAFPCWHSSTGSSSRAGMATSGSDPGSWLPRGPIRDRLGPAGPGVPRP